MLLAILHIYSNVGSTDFQLISLSDISLDTQKNIMVSILLSFCSKNSAMAFNWLAL